MHLRHSECSEESSHFLYHNTRLYWMFRGYASQHDAKRFGVRMTAKTFRALVILLPLLRHFERSEKSSYISYHNTRLHWMFRGYASQHDAKRFGVRMTQHKTLLDPSGFQPSG